MRIPTRNAKIPFRGVIIQLKKFIQATVSSDFPITTYERIFEGKKIRIVFNDNALHDNEALVIRSLPKQQ